MHKHLLYYFSAFICGMAVMAVEVSAARLLAPYFGNSLYVWTNILGLVMVALAAGYYFGGRLADKHPNRDAYFALVFLTGVWTVLIPFAAPALFENLTTGFPNLALTVKWGSFFAVGFLLTVPMFLLGMIVPFTVKLVIKNVASMGRESGQISTVSTLGSLLGTFLPAFLLIPTMGTTKTFVFIGLVLIFLAAFGLRKWWAGLLALAGLGLFLVVPPVYANGDVIHAEDSPYGYIFVTEDEEGVRRLHIDNPLGTQSVYDPDSVIPGERYYYSYFGVLPALVDAPQTMLILGHAGGSFTRIFNSYYPQIEITGVEIDPVVTRISQEYMGLSEAEVEIVHADARTFLEYTDQRYDLILIDTYHSSNIPAHLATQEFFALAESRLTEDGVLALNAASAEGVFLDTLVNTLASAFTEVGTVKIPNSFNTMIVGHEGFEMSAVPQALADKAAYVQENLEITAHTAALESFTDDKMSRIEILTEQMYLELMKGFKLR
ncbi:MAG: fused MFS/spermidine synthase [Patescibacteria group bacterium]